MDNVTSTNIRPLSRIPNHVVTNNVLEGDLQGRIITGHFNLEPVRVGNLNGRTVNTISHTPLSILLFKFFVASVCLGGGISMLNYSHDTNDRGYAYFRTYVILQSCCCLWLFSRLMSSEDF